MSAVSLPVDQALRRLRKALSVGHAVLVAPPGSGKTTRVPLALLSEPWLAGQRILMLEPRRPAARMAATFMASQLGEPVGRTVGYRMRMEQRIGPDTRIEVLTEGLLVRRLQADPLLEGVGLVIFDEFHERSLAADLGLALALEVAGDLRDDLRLLVMSATLEGEAVAGLLQGTLIEAPGGLHPVTLHSLPRSAGPDVLGATTRLVKRACREQAGDVLVFLPGRREMAQLAERLEGLDAEVLELHGGQDPGVQARVLQPPPGHRRRVVLATDVAETSLTIEGIEAVVDSGLTRKPVFDPDSGLSRLQVQPVSRASADQRAGRAGRLGTGHCYRAFTEAEYRARPAARTPEILQQDLAPLALELALWGERDPHRLAWLDPLPVPAWEQALEVLRTLGAIDSAGLITPQGRRLARLGLHPRLGYLLLSGGADDPAAELAALLSERDPWRGASEGPPPADLSLRLLGLEALAAGRLPDPALDHRALAWIARLARRLGRLKGQVGEPSRPEPCTPAGLIALAWPERIAQLRSGGRGRYRLANGSGGWLPADDTLAGAQWLAVARIEAGPREGRIQLALPIERELLERLHARRIESVDELEWDAPGRRVVRRRRRMLGALVLEEQALPPGEGEAVTATLLEGLRRVGLECLPWTPESRQLQARVALAAQLDPEGGWPRFDDAWLEAHLEEWLAPWLGGLRSLEALQRLDLAAILAERLGWSRQQRLDEWLPGHWRLADGGRAVIDYRATPPVLAAPLQAFYGLAQGPAVAGGRVPLQLHLLSPAGRPVQVTSDLAAFWSGAWPQVRKELRGRYPKHHWPEDPLHSPPVRLKRALKKS